MSPSIATTISRVMGGDPTSVPIWPMPMRIEPSRRTPLEPISGRPWWGWPDQRFELGDPGEPIPQDDPSISNTTYLQDYQPDGTFLLTPVRAYVRGTHAARLAVVEKPPPSPAAQQPLDFLDGNALLNGSGGNGRFAIRGTDSIIDRYRTQLGVEFYPGADPFAFEYSAPGGSLVIAHRRDLQDLAPLLAPKINTGAAPGCEYPNHSGYVEARSLREASPAPRPWCMECGLS